MMRKSHIITSEAIVTTILLAVKSSPEAFIIAWIGIWGGVQLPDIDNSNTRLSKKSGFIGKFLSKHLQHRTWTHTAWLGIILAYLAYKLPVPFPNWEDFMPPWNPHAMNLISPFRWLYITFVIGFWLHLIEDDFSRSGIIWFYPFGNYYKNKTGRYRGRGPYKKRKMHDWYYYTGGSEEKGIRITCLGILAIEVLYFIFERL